MIENKDELFGENGSHIEDLANLIMNPETKKGTLDIGSIRENLAVQILNNRYKTLNILRYCDGDVRDKYKGQDMMVTYKGVSKFLQVKPTWDLFETVVNGKKYYVFKSKNTYKKQNIQLFGFINNVNNFVFLKFIAIDDFK